jgi:hypothetical protein
MIGISEKENHIWNEKTRHNKKKDKGGKFLLPPILKTMSDIIFCK